jgi:fucose 4-O-acetylase-like acetyltransferase
MIGLGVADGGLMSRNQNVELVRIIAAFGIVVFHSGATGAALGYSGLVAFTALATFFAKGGVSKLAKRVLIPWVFWSLFYLGWRFAADGSAFHEGMSPIASILYGTHLWFLPFIFAANLAAGLIRSRWLPMGCALAAFVLLAGSPWWRELQLATDPPLTQMLHALPAALLGVALRERASMIVAGAGLISALLWDVPGVSIPYAVGGGAVIAALLLPQFVRNVEPVSGLMFGVYLVHIAALGVFNRIVGSGTLLTAAAAFAASLLGVWMVRRLWAPSKIVLG